MKAAWIVLCLSSLLLLTGCWNNRPIESRALVLVLGVDPGEHGNLKVSVQLPSPSALQGVTSGSAPKKPTSFVIEGEGPTMASAFNAVQSRSEHEIYLGQMQAVVVSTHLSDDQFRSVDAYLSRFGPADKSAYLVATEQPAATILAFQPEGARFAALYLHTLFGCATCQVAHLERMVWDEEKAQVCPATDAWMPLIKADGDFHVDRVVVYDKTHPALILDPQETLALGYLLGITHKAEESMPTSWGRAGLRAVRATPTSSARLEGGQLVADINLKVAATLDSYALGAATPANMHELEILLSRSLAERAAAVIAKLQSHGVNPLRLGDAILWHHPELVPQWKDLYKNARITVKVSTRVTDVGDAT